MKPLERSALSKHDDCRNMTMPRKPVDVLTGVKVKARWRSRLKTWKTGSLQEKNQVPKPGQGASGAALCLMVDTRQLHGTLHCRRKRNM